MSGEKISRQRVMTYDGRRGWLLFLPQLPDDPPMRMFDRAQFNGDDANSITLFITGMAVGGPGDLRRRLRRKNKAELPHEKHWVTAELVGGETFTYCLEEFADQVCWPKGTLPTTVRLPGIDS